MKGTSATSIYGIEGKNGVVDIKTKSFTIPNLNSNVEVAKTLGNSLNQNQNISLGNIDKALIILDGKEISKAEVNLLKVASIESISVIKGTQATLKYGEKASVGVVLITTKKF